MNVTAINVFIEIDGKQYIAPVTAESAELFIGMLPAFQSGKITSARASMLSRAGASAGLSAFSNAA